ncbi:NADP-dependent glyceraldehyde-3-phosphate dehydrogenase [Clostridium massiliamazoniense]|uniref:NADP-dependent glyceraldehyde-3-phosphate dehydrogenase n=1 Tax=Clostridium massiliamazoniense TaxID=1347366 RepID=UPI0006D860E3|nr:NADP-dependent glyceraldehyde-3-phosphate dehydrogenase [Clostridium massiliamazoniense]
MTKIYRNIVDGKEYERQNEKFIEIHSPIDGSLLGKVVAMSQSDIDRVMEVSKKRQEEWAAVPVNEKAEILYKVSNLLIECKEEFGTLLAKEVAKSKNSAIGEVIRTADLLRFTADVAKSMEGRSILGDKFPGFKKNKLTMVIREPLGTVLAISPFNYPVNLAASKIGPAIMAGNTVVFKPATQGALSGIYLAEIFHKAGLPAGVLNTVTGKGSEIGDYCVCHKDIDFINFTGSSEIGRRISNITEMKPLLMELGGKDAAIVLEDADLDLTAKNIVSGAFSYSGQRCTAIKRVLVVDEVADKLVEKISEKMKGLKIGNPVLVPDADIVPLIDSKAADYVQDLIEDAKSKGAKLLTGGHREANIIYPTLFDYVTSNMRLAWEEPFGPVLPIIRVKSLEEAIKLANESEYGLQSSVFTKDVDKAFEVALKLQVGTVQVNNKTERGPDHFPFLGVKSSGMGTQGIRNSIESMSRPKGIVLNLH